MFEPYAAFQALDREQRGFINSKNVHMFLKKYQNNITERECFFLIKVFDQGQTDILKYPDFLRIVLPRDNSELHYEIAQRTSLSGSSCLPYDVEYALARLLCREIETHKRIEKLRENLVTRFDFNPLEAFKIIDRVHECYLDFANIETFLNRTKKYLGEEFIKISEEDIAAFVRRLDRDDDCRISYNEFMEGVLPLDSTTKRTPAFAIPTEASLIKAPANTLGTITDSKEQEMKLSKPVQAIYSKIIKSSRVKAERKTESVYVSSLIPVSYTHLRAHETSLHLVCRLLLEKKKNQKTNTRNMSAY
eukprot:TRINITY_DN42893_c0_g1_i1.p1 TRINITY_DN42893_c0_g1~~TRINITY_DN42893_c0_g1_i1.p1  ORF type:complete len:350 (-),score=39.99 TRINITY_DN42893_c0_g1_i1:79-993(-)